MVVRQAGRVKRAVVIPQIHLVTPVGFLRICALI